MDERAIGSFEAALRRVEESADPHREDIQKQYEELEKICEVLCA